MSDEYPYLHPGDSTDLDPEKDAYALYRLLSQFTPSAKVYVDTQDGHAYRVVNVGRDEDGDVILKTVEYESGPSLRKHG